MRRLAGRKPTGADSEPLTRCVPSLGGTCPAVRVLGGVRVRPASVAGAGTTICGLVVAIRCIACTPIPSFATATPPAPQIAADQPDDRSGQSRAVLSVGGTRLPDDWSCQSVTSSVVRRPGSVHALDYSARESISLLQVRSTPTLDYEGCWHSFSISSFAWPGRYSSPSPFSPCGHESNDDPLGV